MTRMLAVLALALVFADCHCSAKEGDPCEDDYPFCPDDHDALFCDQGNYKLLRCPGSSGCYVRSQGSEVIIWCDLEGTQPGDECPSDYQDFILCLSGSTALRCTGVDWSPRDCTVPCVSGKPGVGGYESAGVCDGTATGDTG